MRTSQLVVTGFVVLFFISFTPTSLFAGYLRQDASGNWISTDDSGNTTYANQTANGNWKASNSQGTTYYNQGANLASWSSSYQPVSYASPQQASQTSYSNQNVWNPMAMYQYGANLGNSNPAPYTNYVQNAAAMMMASQQMQLQAQNENVLQVMQKYPDLQDQNSQLYRRYCQAINRHPEYRSDINGPFLAMRDMEQEMQQESNTLLENNKKLVLEKYPQLNDENSALAQRFKKVISQHPEYLSKVDGPVLTMRKMEEELSSERAQPMTLQQQAVLSPNAEVVQKAKKFSKKYDIAYEYYRQARNAFLTLLNTNQMNIKVSDLEPIKANYDLAMNGFQSIQTGDLSGTNIIKSKMIQAIGIEADGFAKFSGNIRELRAPFNIGGAFWSGLVWSDLTQGLQNNELRESSRIAQEVNDKDLCAFKEVYKDEFSQQE